MTQLIFRSALVLSGSFGLLLADNYRFSVPLQSLQTWSDKIVVSMNVNIDDHSTVHLANKDCEMHFGGTATSYDGVPAGWVFEPMNVCKESFFGTARYSKKAWIAFADKQNGRKDVAAEGVPRIWPEHLSGGEPGSSNPDHALELHPLTKLKDHQGKTRDFRSFIYAPDGLTGISTGSQEEILRDTTLSAQQVGAQVRIDMEATQYIGNFADLDVYIDPKTVVSAPGGHRMLGEAEVNGKRYPVRMVSVTGGEIDDTITSMIGGQNKRHLSALVLFSLNPKRILDAAGGGSSQEPIIQLILYGETE